MFPNFTYVCQTRSLRRPSCGKWILMMNQTVHSTVLSVIAVRLFVIGRGRWPSKVFNRGSSELFIFLVVYRFRANVSWSFLQTHEHPNTSTWFVIKHESLWSSKKSLEIRKKNVFKKFSRSWPVVRRLTTVDPVVVLSTLRFVVKFNVRNVFVDLCGQI